MATNTHVAIQTVTVGSATSTIDFTSIPSTYTDLQLVVNTGFSALYDLRFRVNGLSTSIYSETYLYGTGSSAGSARETTSSHAGYGQLTYYGAPNGTVGTSVQIIDFMNYSSTSTYKTVLSRSSRADSGTDGSSILVQTASAINQITLYCGNSQGNFLTGSTVTLYGIKAEPIYSAKATGGTITYGADGYTYHTFTSSGTFTPAASISNVDYLVVAGGGGGGSSDYIMAGGGAGGLRSTVGYTGGGGTLESAITFPGNAFTVTIGAGGGGNTNGTNSSVSGSGITTITSVGGGYGAGPAPRGTVAQAGGSGGGGCESVSARGTGGAGTANQGYAGGSYTSNSHSRQAGGGGAGAVGGNSGSSSGGAGGNGVLLSAWAAGSMTGANGGYYAGGGGGGEWGGSGQATGGLGGGAYGAPMSQSTGNSGTANTGGGGGGGANTGGTGGSGGSGIVIFRYASA